MHGKATKYLIVESTGSVIVNGILNYAAAFLLFHGRSEITLGGPAGLIRDSIGETFLVTSLSYMVASLVSRQRSRAGTLPVTSRERPHSTANVYLRSFIVGLIFTAAFVPCYAWLLPHLFTNGVTFNNVTVFKVVCGAVLGGVATGMAIYKALNEVIHPREGLAK